MPQPTQGACCSTLLDAAGRCCRSGAVDECGLCDGDGTSCSLRMQLAVRLVPIQEALDDSDSATGEGEAVVQQGAGSQGSVGEGENKAVLALGERDLGALGSVMGWLLQLAVRPSQPASAGAAAGAGGTAMLAGLRLGAVTLTQLPLQASSDANDTGSGSSSNTSATAAATFLCTATIRTTAGDAADGSSALPPPTISPLQSPPGLPPPLGPYRLSTATVGMRLLGLQDALLQLSKPSNTPPPLPLLPPYSPPPSLQVPSLAPGVLVGAGRDGEVIQAAVEMGQQQPEELGDGEQKGTEGQVGEVGSSSGGNSTGVGHQHHHHRRRGRSLSLLAAGEGSTRDRVGLLLQASGIDLELSLAARRQLEALHGDGGQEVKATADDSQPHGNGSALSGTPLRQAPGKPVLAPTAALPGVASAEDGLGTAAPAPAPIAAGPRVVRMTDRQLVAAALSASPDVRGAVVLTLPVASFNATDSSSGGASAASGQVAQRFRLVVELYGMDRYGTCGNGVCEVGEQPMAYSGATQGQGSPYYTPCPADCPVPPLLTCPVGVSADASSTGNEESGAAGGGGQEGQLQLLPCSGRGTCLPASGACECFEG